MDEKQQFLVDIIKELRTKLEVFIESKGLVDDEDNPFLINWEDWWNPSVLASPEVLAALADLTGFLEEKVDASFRSSEIWRLVIVFRGLGDEGLYIDFERIDRR